MMPEGWGEQKIRDLPGSGTRPVTKLGPFGSSLKKSDYKPSGYKVYGQQQVLAGDQHFGDYWVDEKKFFELEACSVRPGDILLSTMGSIGSVLRLTEACAPGIINPRLLRLNVDQDVAAPEFLEAYLKSRLAKRQFRRFAQGGTMPAVNGASIGGIIIPLPPLPEQRKIAQILSTWDRAIETAQALLATARTQKRALMQSLLTGKRRFPEFEGQEWKEVRLGDIADVLLGGTPARKEPEYWRDGQNIWLSIADLGPKYLSASKEKITDQGVAKSNVKLLPSGTVVMSFKLTIGKLGITDTPLYTNEAICGFVPKVGDAFDPEFLFQLLHVTDLLQGVDQAVKGKTLNKAKLNKIMVQLPDIEEQKKIASFLLTADQEIENSEASIEGLRTEKKALMQQLLTGKRRVTVDA